MPETLRAFIAIEIPGNILSEIRNLQEDLKDYGFNIRWVRPESIHLTLKFLGDVEAVRINDIAGVVSKTAKGYTPISLKAKDVGVFPGVKRPQVLWVGLAGELEPLLGLQKTLDENLETIGFPKEKRPFKGHLTMGRMKGKIDVNRFGDVLVRFRNFESETFTADRIIVYKSELKPSGADYTKLADASMG